MRKALKVALYIIGSILVLLLCAVLYINSPWGQNFVRARVEAYLRYKLKTEVHIGHLGYGLPKYIVINDALFLDQAKDTLLAVGAMKLDINMLQLFHKKVSIQQILLTGVHSHIYRNTPDTTFSFTYILNAFAGSQTAGPEKPGNNSSSLSFNIDKIKLDDIHARFDDNTGGVKFAINLDHLSLQMTKMNMDSMFFHVKDLSVSGLQTTFDQDTSYLPPTPQDTSKSRVIVIADNVDLKNIGFRYNDNLNKFLFATQLGSLLLQLNKYNRDNNLVDIKKLIVNNSNATLTIGKSTTAPAPIDTIVKIDTTEGWNVRANDVDLAGLNFKMDNENEPRLPYGFDYSHLDLHDFALKLRNLLYSTSVSGDIQHMAVKDKSGLDVRELKTIFHYDEKGVVLKDLLAQTPNTIIQNYFEIHYPSVAAIAKHPGSMQLKMNIQKSIIGIHDLTLFAPDLRKEEMFRKYEQAHVSVEAVANGFLNNLHIAHFYARGFDNTEILLNGSVIKGMPDVNKISYDLNIAKFNSSHTDMEAILPPNILPSFIRLPDRFGAVGHLAGNEQDYNANLVISSTDGAAYVKGSVATSPGKGKEKYDLTIKTIQLNIGHIIKQDTLLGSVSANLYVKGQSFDVKTMSANGNGNISSAYIEGYKYHDLKFSGAVNNQKAELKMLSDDPNIQLQLNANGDFTGKYAAVVADIRIDSIDFHALKFTKSELRARGTIHADFPELNADYPRGSITWYQPVILADGNRYFMDSVYAISRPGADSGQNIFVNLGVMDAHLTGRVPLTSIGSIIQEHIDRHYSTELADSLKANIAKLTQSKSKRLAINPITPPVKQAKKDTTSIPADYNLNLLAHVYDKPMLHSLLTGLTSFDSIHVDASITPGTMTLNASSPEVVYGQYTVENAVVILKENDSALNYKLNVDQITEANYGVYFADVHGAVNQNVITTDVSLSDANKKERFAFKTTMQIFKDSEVIQLLPGLKLDYQAWDVKQPNRTVFANDGFYMQNFGISNKDQSITAASDQQKINTPLKININNFQLANLTDITSKNDTLLANGILSGNIVVEQFTPATKLTGDLQIQNLSILGDTLGNMQASADNKTDDQINTKIALSGHGNDIQLTGFYDLKANNNNVFNFSINVNALAVSTFEGLTMHQVKSSSGYLRGNLKLTGTMTSPNVTGELTTDQLKTTVTAINTEFKMPADKITFAGDKIALNDFAIVDSAGNKATINGSIGISDVTNPDLNLTVVANNWQAIHSTAKENKELYGDLKLTTKLNISGTAMVPNVDGTLSILKGTKLTVTNPQTDPEIESSKGIVLFVNMRDTSWGKALMARTDTVKIKHKLAPGSDINVNITVDKEAEFSIIIDEASGDFVSVHGDAYLNTSVSPGGVFDVTGSYLLHGGTYQMNYNFIKRKFQIKDGSLVTFEGDPLKNTQLDVSATYEANAPAYDLVTRQVTDPTQLNYYKESLPFDVDLHMKGNLMQPSFTFDVVLPENKVYPLNTDQIQLIQARLSQLRQDTTELNKQVFAVLILGRFVSDDPFSSSGGESIGFTAIQSVSTFIGEELNNAARNLVKGVDLSADLATTQDYTTGDMRQRTDLNLAASKRVLNDRLKLTVGNDFEVEGPQPNNNTQGGVVPSNLAADYLLSSDGRYTVRVYRREYNEGVLQGYVTETGVNFIVSVDYDHFKTIFWKTKRRTPSTTDTTNNHAN